MSGGENRKVNRCGSLEESGDEGEQRWRRKQSKKVRKNRGQNRKERAGE